METWPCLIHKKWERGIVIFLIIALSSGVSTDDEPRCGPGITTPGVTVPTGDIILEYGQPLEILCILSPNVVSQGLNSSDLVFYHTSFRLAPEFVTLVNESTARLYIEKPEPMKDMFYCKLTNKSEEVPVCLNTVAVGHYPQAVTNFSCVSYNWDNLNCTWVPPVNHVKTTYTLVFYLPGRAGARNKSPCPNDTDVKNENYCYWDQRTKTPYRQPYEYYYFVMTGSNAFGAMVTKTKFHHYAHVIPAKASNLTCIERTVDRALIQWSVVFPMQNFPPGLQQKVEYQSQWDPRDYWEVVDTSCLNIKNATHQLNITGLKYANSLYDFRVFMRSPLAIGEDMWSQPATINIRTLPTVPGAAPKTDIGSFEVTTVGLTSRDVYVYWQHIPEYLYNGDHFSYNLEVEEDGVVKNLKPNETTSAYAKFKSLSLNSYRFRIRSQNQKGFSRSYSEVFVPSHSKSLAEPLSFTKVAFDHHIYELSWKPPVTNNLITSYTIFWCDHDKDRPYQCAGTLNWTKVPFDVTIKNITVPDDKIYQFAISANTEMESSGMVWASCTVIHNRILGKMKSIWINNIGSTFIEVGWKLECSDRIGMVTGFQISYCPIEASPHPHNITCKVEAKNTTIKGDGMTMRGNVTNLKPYTTYMLMVAVITKNSIGLWSDRLLNTTMEDAPTPPRNVVVSEVTNSSMLVSWSPPESTNGPLRQYRVHYNDKMHKIEVPLGLHPQKFNTQFQLTNLESFVQYRIAVSACTGANLCSPPSEPVLQETSIGSPSTVDRPHVQISNLTSVILDWKRPEHPGGPLSGYQVKREIVDWDNESYIIGTDLFNISGGNETRVKMELPVDCTSGHKYHYKFSVRAWNTNKKQEPLFSAWSSSSDGPCLDGEMTTFWLILIIVMCFVILSLIVASIFTGKRVWERYKEMRNVQIQLPTGLAPAEKPSEKDLIISNMYGLKPPVVSEKKEVVQSSPDQEHLLQNKMMVEMEGEGEAEVEAEVEGEGDGDSSGCCSGHDSVTSSIISGTQISSDSGTEADQLPERTNSLDRMFSPSNSLRQRNKACSSYSSDSSRWDRNEPYVMLGGGKSTPNLSEGEGAKGYALLGGGAEEANAGWRPTPLASGYVSLPSATAPVPPHQAHPPIKEGATPNKNYVYAGEPAPSQYSRLDYVPHSHPRRDL